MCGEKQKAAPMVLQGEAACDEATANTVETATATPTISRTNTIRRYRFISLFTLYDTAPRNSNGLMIWYTVQMNLQQPKRSFRVSFWLLSLGIIGLELWSLSILKDTSALYDGIIHTQNTVNSGSVEKVEFPGTDTTVNIASWSLFKAGNILSLTSAKHSLPADFKVPPLTNTTVAHGDSAQNMRVQTQIEAPLHALYNAADTDGIPLMLSSAYRSVADQKKLYSDFTAKYGADSAARYVAKPGSSEHHTGLAVDFASASDQCQQNSDKCSLATDAALWLQENAATYGFIQRYPEGKQPMTGVSFEPWHYRYVGVPMAKAVTKSGLTYDEAVQQMAPGYTK